MKRIIQMFLCITLILLTGCTGGNNNVKVYTTATNDDVQRREESLTGVLTKIDEDANEMSFIDVIDGSNIELAYHNGISIQNTYDKEILFENLKLGCVYDVSYYDDTRKVMSLKESSNVTTLKGIVKFSADRENGKAKYKGTSCRLAEYAVAFDGKYSMDITEVNTEDQVTLYLYGDKLVSASVELGHGYVRLFNHESYIGGMVEIGKDVIVPVTENMLVAVREGSYTLRINKGSYSESKHIEVKKGLEARIDLYDLAIPTGTVYFNISPEDANATLYVDDNAMDEHAFSGLYGAHKFKITAEGYDTYKGSIKIANPVKEYNIELKKNKDNKDKEDDKDSSTTQVATVSTTAQATTSSTQTTGTVTSEVETTVGEGASFDKNETDENGSTTQTKDNKTEANATANKITIKEPVGVSVYVDGDYVGIAPVSFSKVVGTHTVTLYMKGFIIKSYTIQAVDNGKDDEYKYAQLVPLTSIME